VNPPRATIHRTFGTISAMPDDDGSSDATHGDLLPRDPAERRELVDDDLPIVARLVVEVRSDGRRTIARGGLEDVATGKRVTIDARGDSPAQLALALARSLFRLPQLAARAGVRGLLGRKKP
jgi:hypothetical protein